MHLSNLDRCRSRGRGIIECRGRGRGRGRGRVGSSSDSDDSRSILWEGRSGGGYLHLLDRSDGKRSNWQRSGGVVDKGRGDKLDRGERCSYSLVQSRMVEVGVDGRAVVGEVEKVSWSVGHVVVGEGLGGGKCGGGVVDNVLVRGVGGKDLGNQEEQYFY